MENRLFSFEKEAVLSFHEFFDFAFVRFRVFVIIDANKKQIARITRQRIEIVFRSDLLYRAHRRPVSLELDNHRRNIRHKRNENNVCKALARCHFFDNGVFIKRIDI